ncbi:MAG TPA: SMP-30/gluconolactonase/LRE family protein [Woeseiaceae bacterium]|jgi:sugar lactone lactonase YvrE|nr:SMP-30/gluconolactonase/LRE family protein [Woeseiaceae bacterium]
MSNVKLEWEMPAMLGEGPLWCARENAVYFVDIMGNAVHRLDVSDGLKRSWQFDFPVTSLVMRERGGLACTIRDAFAFIDLDSGTVDPIVRPETDLANNRFNDGKVDPMGRYWAGTMDDDLTEASGTLYRLDPDLSLHAMDSGYIISNGPAFSPDGRTMYHNECKKGQVFAFDLAADGSISNKRLFAKFDEQTEGLTDGHTVDGEGCLWQTSFGGHCVTRFSPDGEALETVELPVPNITSCTFGGPDLDTLYITTARCDIDDEDLVKYPLAGSLFSCRPGVRGLPTPMFKG